MTGVTRSVTPVTRLRRWCELAEFALDNPGYERTDTLHLLSEELEDALEAAIAEERSGSTNVEPEPAAA